MTVFGVVRSLPPFSTTPQAQICDDSSPPFPSPYLDCCGHFSVFVCFTSNVSAQLFLK